MPKSRTVEYRTWKAMLTRCYNPNAENFVYYGARGIRVCPEWRTDFDQFFADVGPRPVDKHSIDRIDNDGHYEQGNVRWATWKEQNRNNRNTRRITVGGESLPITGWAERLGTTQQVVSWRVAQGWTLSDAVTLPVTHSDRQYGIDIRRVPGSGHHNSKLTEAQVLEARFLRSTGARVIDLAGQFGVNKGTMSTILSGKAWRHVKLNPNCPALTLRSDLVSAGILTNTLPV